MKTEGQVEPGNEMAASSASGLAGRVGEMMHAEHLTLEALSASLRCTRNALWRLRSGKTRSVDLDLLIEIAKWARGKGYSLDWLLLGIAPAIRAETLSPERQQAVQIANRAAIILCIGAMASGLGLDLTDMSRQWGAELARGLAPEINGIELMQRIDNFIRELKK